MQIFRSDVDKLSHIIVTYQLLSNKSVRDAAWDIAIGQSIGNPNVRNEWETNELIEAHACKVLAKETDLEDSRSGIVKIAFPIANLNIAEDGISQLLCQVMGGQLDIDHIKGCRITDIEFPNYMRPPEQLAWHVRLSGIKGQAFQGAKHGINGIRSFTKVKTNDGPILGGIVKPKTGMPPEKLLDMVKQLVDGGVNFIKEDEIMASPACCPLRVRVPLISDYLAKQSRPVIYAVCINSDPPYALQRATDVFHMGGNAVHLNFWSGMGTYKAIRELDLPIFTFFQKSGDKILTNSNHRFGIDWHVICKLAAFMGVDFIHAGMWGGYMNDNEAELRKALNVLQKYGVMPSLSCGMHPGLVSAIVERFGPDLLLNVGGAIHGHPDGTLAGAKAMRDAIDGNDSPEYRKAIEKWGKK